MPISAYVGLPGSGKSYACIEHVILPALKDGRRVWTNIPCDLDAMREQFGAAPVLFDIKDVANDPAWFQTTFEPGATIILDEAWKLWPGGLKATNMLDGHKAFLAEHRHMVGEDGRSTEVVLVVQDLANIATYPRNLVEFTYKAVKLAAVGREDTFRVDVYQGAASGPNPPERNRVRQLFGKYKPEVWRFYRSHTMSRTGDAGDESRTDRRMNILRSPWLRFGIPGLAVLVLAYAWFAFSKLGEMYGDDGAELAPGVGAGSAVEQAGRPSSSAAELQPARRERGFLDGRDAWIALNLGRLPMVRWEIGVREGEAVSFLSPLDLGKLGYRFEAITECLVTFTGHGRTHYVQCLKAEPDQRPGVSLGPMELATTP